MAKPRAVRNSPAQPHASLKELARHLELSQTTVSRVVNQSPGAGRISLDTQKRVLAAARQMNYTPSVLARGLRSKRSQTVAVIVPEISEGYSTTVLTGIEDALLLSEYFYFVVSHRHRPELLRKYAPLLISRAVEGIITVGTLLETGLTLPTVSVSAHKRRRSAVNIELDHLLAAQYALEHLHILGHREIAIIKGQRFSSDTIPRWHAIQTTARSLGIRLQPKLVVELEGTGLGTEAGRVATVKLLQRNIPFTAIFAFNDISAIGAIQALKEADLSVPRQISVIGFDDVTAAATNSPPLTTVRQPLREMGRVAATTLLQMLNGGTAVLPSSDSIRVLPSFIERQSTAPVAQLARRSVPTTRTKR
jgi:DNA-binding LacI/PurR family transcriptional regulator